MNNNNNQTTWEEVIGISWLISDELRKYGNDQLLIVMHSDPEHEDIRL
mgnify:FL=1